MSAYIVSPEHIAALLTAGIACTRRGGSPLRWSAPETEEPNGEADYLRGEPWGPTSVETAQRRRRTLTLDNADAVGFMLMAQNHASVNHRYDTVDEMPLLYRYPLTLEALPPVQILKALDGYEYQACEGPAYEQSEAHSFCASLRKRMIQRLPGYEEAKWSL